MFWKYIVAPSVAEEDFNSLSLMILLNFAACEVHFLCKITSNNLLLSFDVTLRKKMSSKNRYIVHEIPNI